MPSQTRPLGLSTATVWVSFSPAASGSPMPTAAILKSTGARVARLGLPASQLHLESPLPAQAAVVPFLLEVFLSGKDQQTVR